MKNLSYYFKSKEFLITTFLFFAFAIINMIPSFRYGYLFLEFKDCFAFFQVILTYGYGTYFQIVLPLFILYISLRKLYFKFKGSYLKNALLKEEYSQFCKKEFFKSYLQAYFPLFLVISFVFIVGFILYPDKLTPPNSGSEYLFLTGIVQNPYVYVLISYLCRFLFVAMIVNIGLIFIYYIKKFYVAILAGYVAFNLLNFLFQFIVQTIGYCIGGTILWQKASNLNLMQGYTCVPDVILSLIVVGFFFVLTLALVFFVYHDKEKVVRNFEE